MVAEEVEELEADLKDVSDLDGNFVLVFELEEVEVGVEEIEDYCVDCDIEDE